MLDWDRAAVVFMVSVMAVPPLPWFCQQFLPIKRELFLPTVANCLLIEGPLMVRDFSVCLCCFCGVFTFVRSLLVSSDNSCCDLVLYKLN